MPDKSYISGNVENGPIFDILVGNLLAYRPEEWGWSEQDYQKISSDFGVAENDLYHLPVANYVILNYPDNLLPSGANTDVEDYRLQVYSIQSDELTKYLLLYIGNHTYKATITAIGQIPNWEDITEYGADGLKIISFHIGDKAPSDTSKIWIDTSKLASDGYITLFFYDAASGEWKNYYVNGLMDKSIYDTQNKNTDPFLYVMDQIEAIIGDYAEFIRHKNNELTLIHVTSEEKEYYNTQLISKEDLKNMFSSGGSVYEELLTYIKNNVSDKFNIDKFTDDINGIKEKLQNHIDNHITAEKVTSWINKADGDHEHNQDGKVTIHGTDIKGDPYTSDQLPDNIKERVTIVSTEDERLALTIDQVQNGDAVCVEDTDGNLVWYRVIDDTKLGVEYAEESKWKETSNRLSERNWRSICYGNDKYVAVSDNSNTVAYSTDGINWTETSNGINGSQWISICYGNDKYVMIDHESNVFAYSTDGINWTETSNGINQVNWWSICYGNGKYVAVSGNSNTFAYSSDGINWTETSNGLSDRNWMSICYGKDKYVAVANHTNSFYIAYSTNGINWTEINTGLSLAYARNICYGNGKYVAISYANTFAYSSDGINWTEINNELDIGYWISICYGNGKYVVVAEYQNTFAYSTDGITWIGTSNGLSSRHWQSICYGNDKYVAVSNSNTFAYWNGSLGNEEAFIKFTSTILETSFSNIKNKPTTLEGYGITDGANKSKLDVIEERIENNLENLIYVPNGYDNTSIGENELYVGVQKSLSAEGGGTIENPMSYKNSLLDVITYIDSGSENTIKNKFAYLSENHQHAYLQESNYTPDSRYFYDVCYGNGKYVAISDSNIFAYSTDGIAWGETSNGLNTQNWRSICYGNEKYVVVAYGSNTFAYSTDGIIWTETTNGLSDNYWISICYGNEKYVVVAYGSNTFAYSTDGINWTETSNGLTKNEGYVDICYGNGKYVAISGNSNTVVYSTNGINWTETIRGLNTTSWMSICYGNNKYVAVSNYFNIFAYSTDGINWTETTNGLNERNWCSICYGNGKYVAVAFNDNTFAYSTDGINWTETTNGLSGREWLSVCYGNNKYIICGNSDIIENVYFLETPKTIGGFAKFPTTYTKDDYFSTLYQTDEENPKYTSDGLGMMVKVDTTQNNIVCDKTYNIGDKAINLLIGYDIEKGLYFKTEMGETVKSLNSMYGVLMRVGDPLLALLNGYKAKFPPSQYTITFKTEIGGKINNGTDDITYTLESGQPFPEIPNVTSDSGYKFDNWYDSSDNVVSEWPATVTKNETYTAKYNVIPKYTITFNAGSNCILNGGNKTYTVLENDPFPTVPTIIPNSEYEIDGWYDSDNIKVVSWPKTVTKSETYTAKVKAIPKYTITFKTYSNGTLSGTTSFTLLRGSKFPTVPTVKPNSGYKFDNWYKSNGIKVTSWPTTVTRSETYTAKYIKLEIKWYETSNGLNERWWQSICYGNGKYVAVASSSNTFAYSTNGINWTETSNGLNRRSWQSICYGKDKYVAVASSSNTFAYSTNGINWTETSNGLNDIWWRSICYGNGKYVAVSGNSNTFAYSTNGINWTETSNGLNERWWQSICYGNGKYVAVSDNNSNTFAYSTNGINWTETSNGISERSWSSICYGKDKYVAVSQSNTFAYSSDGITWTETSNGLSNVNWNGICYGKDKYVAAASVGGTGTAYSVDGINWTEIRAELVEFGWQSICYGNNKYVMIAINSNIFAYSTLIPE